MDNQQRLLDCALELFSLRNYEAVSVREVVEAAGVTKPTLYHYFDSKRGLLDALLKREAGQLLTKILSAGIYQGDLVLTLENITKAYFDFGLHASSFYRMQLSMYFSPPESESNQAIRPYAKAQREILEVVFINAAKDHDNLGGRHQRYATAFLGVINARIDLYLNDKLTLDEDIVYQTVHQFMYGIFS